MANEEFQKLSKRRLQVDCTLANVKTDVVSITKTSRQFNLQLDQTTDVSEAAKLFTDLPAEELYSSDCPPVLPNKTFLI